MEVVWTGNVAASSRTISGLLGPALGVLDLDLSSLLSFLQIFILSHYFSKNS